MDRKITEHKIELKAGKFKLKLARSRSGFQILGFNHDGTAIVASEDAQYAGVDSGTKEFEFELIAVGQKFDEDDFARNTVCLGVTSGSGITLTLWGPKQSPMQGGPV